VAVHRAVHQVSEGGRIFSGSLCRTILGPDSEVFDRGARFAEHRHMPVVRWRCAAAPPRTLLQRQWARGVRQVVVLGAGLDTTALRNPGLAVLKWIHPATQDWKRMQLASMNTPCPRACGSAAVDFERQDIADGLAGGSFARPSRLFLSGWVWWPYLTRDAIEAERWISLFRSWWEIVFDIRTAGKNYPLKTAQARQWRWPNASRRSANRSGAFETDMRLLLKTKDDRNGSAERRDAFGPAP